MANPNGPPNISYKGNIATGQARAQYGHHYGHNITNNYSGRGDLGARAIPNIDGEAAHPRQNDYTVAWICALPVPELQASRLLLDKKHDPVPLPHSKHQYVFGEMNGHNVVMGCLPDTQMGRGAAASVAAEMSSTFPKLRFGLLVGVGGGVWDEENDVRLGDVVVSRPNKDLGTGGVIQYDYGKAVSGGRFQRMGMLNQPPTILLSGLGLVQSGNPEESKFFEYLDSFLRYRDSLPKYAKKPKAADRLFKASYVHSDVKAKSCDKLCPPEEEVERDERETTRPQVHYGTIASGDEVIKDAELRDVISEEHGIICFEMEAAGLMNQFPCLVIRGICDYCDSHKNKTWQPYAAAAAAAWAKDLLGNISADKTRQTGAGAERDDEAVIQGITVLPYDRDLKFIGRSAILDSLHHRLIHPGRQSRIALFGLGGIGKSQVAIECAYRVQEQRPDTHILWIHASSPERFAQSCSDITSKVQLHGHDDPAVDQVHLALTWLKSVDCGTWLLVIDNADDYEFLRHTERGGHGHRDIASLLPRKQGCAVLLTSRNRRAAMDFVGNGRDDVVEIVGMAEQEAIDLLHTKMTSSRHNDDNARELVAYLDFIPLAISQAAAYIQQRDMMSLAGYLQLLQDDSILALAEDYSDLRRDPDVPNSVIKTWGLSLSYMEQHQPAAADLFAIICLYDRQAIPVSLLGALGDNARVDEDIEIQRSFMP